MRRENNQYGSVRIGAGLVYDWLVFVVIYRCLSREPQRMQQEAMQDVLLNFGDRVHSSVQYTVIPSGYD
jgi:hypothetical protein